MSKKKSSGGRSPIPPHPTIGSGVRERDRREQVATDLFLGATHLVLGGTAFEGTAGRKLTTQILTNVFRGQNIKKGAERTMQRRCTEERYASSNQAYVALTGQNDANYFSEKTGLKFKGERKASIKDVNQAMKFNDKAFKSVGINTSNFRTRDFRALRCHIERIERKRADGTLTQNDFVFRGQKIPNDPNTNAHLITLAGSSTEMSKIKDIDKGGNRRNRKTKSNIRNVAMSSLPPEFTQGLRKATRYTKGASFVLRHTVARRFTKKGRIRRHNRRISRADRQTNRIVRRANRNSGGVLNQRQVRIINRNTRRVAISTRRGQRISDRMDFLSRKGQQSFKQNLKEGRIGRASVATGKGTLRIGRKVVNSKAGQRVGRIGQYAAWKASNSVVGRGARRVGGAARRATNRYNNSRFGRALNGFNNSRFARGTRGALKGTLKGAFKAPFAIKRGLNAITSFIEGIIQSIKRRLIMWLIFPFVIFMGFLVIVPTLLIGIFGIIDAILGFFSGLFDFLDPKTEEIVPVKMGEFEEKRLKYIENQVDNYLENAKDEEKYKWYSHTLANNTDHIIFYYGLGLRPHGIDKGSPLARTYYLGSDEKTEVDIFLFSRFKELVAASQTSSTWDIFVKQAEEKNMTAEEEKEVARDAFDDHIKKAKKVYQKLYIDGFNSRVKSYKTEIVFLKTREAVVEKFGETAAHYSFAGSAANSWKNRVYHKIGDASCTNKGVGIQKYNKIAKYEMDVYLDEYKYNFNGEEKKFNLKLLLNPYFNSYRNTFFEKDKISLSKQVWQGVGDNYKTKDQNIDFFSGYTIDLKNPINYFWFANKNKNTSDNPMLPKYEATNVWEELATVNETSGQPHPSAEVPKDVFKTSVIKGSDTKLFDRKTLTAGSNWGNSNSATIFSNLIRALTGESIVGEGSVFEKGAEKLKKFAYRDENDEQVLIEASKNIDIFLWDFTGGKKNSKLANFELLNKRFPDLFDANSGDSNSKNKKINSIARVYNSKTKESTYYIKYREGVLRFFTSNETIDGSETCNGHTDIHTGCAVQKLELIQVDLNTIFKEVGFNPTSEDDTDEVRDLKAWTYNKNLISDWSFMNGVFLKKYGISGASQWFSKSHLVYIAKEKKTKSFYPKGYLTGSPVDKYPEEYGKEHLSDLKDTFY